MNHSHILDEVASKYRATILYKVIYTRLFCDCWLFKPVTDSERGITSYRLTL